MLNSALIDHTHDNRYYTETEINTKLINNTDVSSKYTNFDPSGKFNALDNKSTGWIRMYKNGRLLVFTAALEIKTNFGAWTDYKICDLPYTANGTQYGTAISDNGKVVPLKITANTKTLYISSRNSLLTSSQKEWIWCNITILCTE